MVDDKMCPSLRLPWRFTKKIRNVYFCVYFLFVFLFNRKCIRYTMWMIGIEQAIVVISPLGGYDSWSILEVFLLASFTPFPRLWGHSKWDGSWGAIFCNSVGFENTTGWMVLEYWISKFLVILLIINDSILYIYTYLHSLFPFQRWHDTRFNNISPDIRFLVGGLFQICAKLGKHFLDKCVCGSTTN